MQTIRFGSVLRGAAQQLVNSITQRVTLPIPMLPPAPIGDVFEPRGRDARLGADLVERAIERLAGGPGRVDQNAARQARPLIASAVLTSTGGMQRLRFEARAEQVDWGTRGRESGRLAVYVNGRYWSSVIVMAERGSAYAVDLGVLPAGHVHVELRDPRETVGLGAPAVFADQLRAERLDGIDALVARHAPILELRDVDSTLAHSTSYSDAPMLLVPAVTNHPDGTITIAYRVAFSNEEGGTHTPKLMASYGRTADLEPVYRVRVRADGSIIDAQYQSPVHAWRAFDGERVGDRPVLRTSSANSMSSARTRSAGDGAERWSDAAIAPVGADASDYEVMSAHAWTWTVMAKELIREGKAVSGADAARGAQQIADPRRYLFVGPLSDAQRGAVLARGGIEIVMRDGTRMLTRIVEGFADGPQRQGALELPAGANVDAIVGVALLGVRASVFDASLRIRALADASRSARESAHEPALAAA